MACARLTMNHRPVSNGCRAISAMRIQITLEKSKCICHLLPTSTRIGTIFRNRGRVQPAKDELGSGWAAVARGQRTCTRVLSRGGDLGDRRCRLLASPIARRAELIRLDGANSETLS